MNIQDKKSQGIETKKMCTVSLSDLDLNSHWSFNVNIFCVKAASCTSVHEMFVFVCL